jgi:hypothetical protein
MLLQDTVFITKNQHAALHGHPFRSHAISLFKLVFVRDRFALYVDDEDSPLSPFVKVK